jgi:hypothetical protein
MDVQTAAQNVAEDYRGAGGSGARALAADIGKNPTTFAHQLVEQGGAVLGLKTAVKMTQRSQDLRILNAFAAEVGCMVLHLPETLAVEGNPAMMDLGKMAKEFADVVQEVCATCSDGDVSANELARVEREWGEVVVAGQNVIAALRIMFESKRLKAVA